jgi:hypothetical protein
MLCKNANAFALALNREMPIIGLKSENMCTIHCLRETQPEIQRREVVKESSRNR